MVLIVADFKVGSPGRWFPRWGTIATTQEALTFAAGETATRIFAGNAAHIHPASRFTRRLPSGDSVLDKKCVGVVWRSHSNRLTPAEITRC